MRPLTPTGAVLRNVAITALLALGTLPFLATTSCIFLVDTVSQDPSCKLEGTTACATCIRQKCQAKVDACCSSITCSDIEGHSALLDGLDRCGNGEKTACTNTLITSRSDSFDTTGEALRMCVKAMCNEPCTGAANQ